MRKALLFVKPIALNVLNALKFTAADPSSALLFVLLLIVLPRSLSFVLHFTLLPLFLLFLLLKAVLFLLFFLLQPMVLQLHFDHHFLAPLFVPLILKIIQKAPR